MTKPKKVEIEIRKGASGRDLAYVGRSRVRVADIAAYYTLAEDDLIAERIQTWLPTLTKEQILTAIDYWREHKVEIDKVLREDMEALAQLPIAGSE